MDAAWIPRKVAMRTSSNQHALERIRAEYLEMPGLRLTVQQLQRLCGIDLTVCQTALDSLVDAKFLAVKPHGAYARLADGGTPRPRPAKATLGSKDGVRARITN